ncbi:MAG: hypothetical protein D6730_16475 [Bacteroidetes bacterium]|nr:MAG: hypothetical protein D6730_16475 [Bacteroidota bacterium]
MQARTGNRLEIRVKARNSLRIGIRQKLLLGCLLGIVAVSAVMVGQQGETRWENDPEVLAMLLRSGAIQLEGGVLFSIEAAHQKGNYRSIAAPAYIGNPQNIQTVLNDGPGRKSGSLRAIAGQWNAALGGDVAILPMERSAALRIVQMDKRVERGRGIPGGGIGPVIRIQALTTPSLLGKLRFAYQPAALGELREHALGLYVSRDGGLSWESMPARLNAAAHYLETNVLDLAALWTLGPMYPPSPVELLYFRAAPRNGSVLLTWESTFELNNAYYEVERSADLKSWTSIGRLRAVGNSRRATVYSLTDHDPFTYNNYYRLKQYSTDGTVGISEVRHIQGLQYDTSLQVQKKGDMLSLKLKSPKRQRARISWVNARGEALRHFVLGLNKGNCSIDMYLPTCAEGAAFFTFQSESHFHAQALSSLNQE